MPNLLTASSTSYLGVYVRHWPEGYPTVTSKNGKKRPALPPFVFGVPQSYLQQCKHNKPDRKVKKRKVDSESRALKENEETVDSDIIRSWDDLLTFCKSLPLIQVYTEDKVKLIKLDDKMPPSVVYSILIHRNFRVTAFRGHHQIAIKDLIQHVHMC